MEIKLVSVDSKNKVRLVKLYWEKENSDYLLKKETGVWNGKMILQPVHRISCGKVKRTIEEQRDLEFNSMLKKYLDKGYKKLDDLELPANYTENDIIGLIGSATDSNGVPKPMLAKQYQDVSPTLLENEWLGSRKINGVRCLMFYKDGKVCTKSRTAISYDLVTEHIITHPKLIEFFQKNPDLILDGELYKAGWPLNKIGGLCRKEVKDPEMVNIEYYVYDIVKSLPFKDRLILITNFASTLKLSFNPNRTWEKDELKIQILPHVSMKGASVIKQFHDEYVKEGWEGLVIRNPNSIYKVGSRGNDMLKYKAYFDAEYKILGITEGLRREDFTFLMETPFGNTFEAKPIGSREIREEYRKNLDKLIGKRATIKYFELSGTGSDVPQQPIFIGVRNYE